MSLSMSRSLAKCLQKIKYLTRANAEAALKLLRANGGGKSAGVYRCGHCGGWHVGRDRGFAFRGRG